MINLILAVLWGFTYLGSIIVGAFYMGPPPRVKIGIFELAAYMCIGSVLMLIFIGLLWCLTRLLLKNARFWETFKTDIIRCYIIVLLNIVTLNIDRIW